LRCLFHERFANGFRPGPSVAALHASPAGRTAIRELVAGHPVHTHDLVVSLRNFIREALDLAPIPSDLMIPQQGPTRPSASGARGKSDRGNEPSSGGWKGGMGGGGHSWSIASAHLWKRVGRERSVTRPDLTPFVGSIGTLRLA
jgi:hypothetical protein